jgi:CRP-like cAMP-binding protein
MQALLNLITDKKERVKKILSKPSTSRTNEELSEVANLLQNVDFLKHFKDKLIDLARYMVLETYLGKKTIVEQGSEGDKFYFILDGKVSIYIKSFNDMTGNEFFVYIY